MKQTKRIVSLLAVLCMVVSILPVSVFGTEEGICPHHETHTAECGYAPGVAEVPCDMACVDTDEDSVVDHVEGCAYSPAQEGTPCNYDCKVCAIQTLVDALPEEVTAENSEAVTQQLVAIDEAKAALSAEELALVDFTASEAAAAKLEELANSETPVCETHAAYVVEGVCRICGIQTLVDALPETVTEDNAAEVAQQLTAIDEAKAAMTAEELALVDFAHYDAIGTALEELKTRITGNEVVVTTEDELRAAIDEANARAAALAEGETMEQMTIRLGADITLTKYVWEELYPELGVSGLTYMTFLEIHAGANVHLTSVEGQTYTLKPDNNPADPYGRLGTYMICVSGTLKVSNIVFNCNSTFTFGSTAIQAENGGHVTICDGTVVTGYGAANIGSPAVDVRSGSTLIMDGGEITGNDSTQNPDKKASTAGLINIWEGTFVMNGGRIHDNIMRCEDMSMRLTGCSGIVGVSAGVNFPTKVTINGGIIENNQFVKGYGSAGSYGGAICCTNMLVGGQLDIVMNDGIIRNNTATYGGAISVVSGNDEQLSTLTINGGEISGNSALGSGGILVQGNVLFTMTDGLITGNSAKQPEEGGVPGEGGGGITIKVGAKGVIEGGKITSNYSDLSGGGIIVFWKSKLTINGGEISGNVAEAHGGGINVADAYSADEESRSVLIMNGGAIKNNTANSIWTSEGHQSDPFAPGGGGVYLHGNCHLYINNGAEISGNKALNYGSGGGVYCSFGGYVEVNGGYLENNTAAKHGGGVHVDGAGSYEGYVHENNITNDDTYGTGAVMNMTDGRITGNTANLNGGGIYVAGQTTAMVENDSGTTEEQVYRGGLVRMSGGVITANTAMDMGGGIYLQAGDKGEYGGGFHMTGGALYFNVAGENGNASSGANDAGADLYAEGGEGAATCFSMPDALTITAYVRDAAHTYVPEADRNASFTQWYDDYSDQDPVYGKGDPETWETGRNTGRYLTSKVMDRIVYTPAGDDRDYEALILEGTTELKLTKIVSGENIPEGEVHTFTITLGGDNGVQGKRLPVTTTAGITSDDLGVLGDGQQYLLLNEDGMASFTMKEDDILTIFNLDKGTPFQIVELDLGAAYKADATVELATDASFDEQKLLVSGATGTAWAGDVYLTMSEVVIENKYQKPQETEPSETTEPTETTEPSESTEPSTTETTAPPASTTPTRPVDGTNPGTGDYLLPVWVLLLLMSGMFLAAAVVCKKKSL